jgi:WD40 repeat protein/tRNA A-37 threonylcarbamoyl transferase component Bud32
MSAHHEKVEALFNEALKLSAAERSAFLAGVCGSDAALHRQLEELLKADAEAGRFLPESPQQAATIELDHLEDSANEALGRMLGRYKLLERVGEGGCGVVYVAEQVEPVRRRVALKVIRPGMDSRSVIARFEAERQALAMMDHPNIAKVLDAGTTENGRPYFVMELVRGIRITDYCDQNKLSTPQRLDLFIKVCNAVQHAHQKGIIHRDLKPSNILVTVNDGVPVPKVIDFGIAKATEGRLTDRTVYTELHQFIGTPAYMSPEQAEMTSLDIDTRSDIYSLGVLLYELLTGRTPFDANKLMQAGLDEIRRTIREVEPPRPSTRLSTLANGDLTTVAKARASEAIKLVSLIRGDLDWIVMKALDKDRTRRYDTANGFAMDVNRFLGNEPVVARPPSAAYRFQKLVRRNKLAFAAAGAIAGVLVLGAAVSTWQAVRATRAQHAEEAARASATENARVAKENAGREEIAKHRAESSELASRQQAYASDMSLAFRSWESGALGLPRELLERQRPTRNASRSNHEVSGDPRGWEWRYLWGQARGDYLAELTKHDALLIRLAVSPDGKLAASADIRGNVKLWDMEVGREVLSTNIHSGVVCALEFSPDGRLLGSDCYDGTIRILEIATHQLIFNPPMATNIEYWHLSFSPDSKVLASVADGPGDAAVFLDLATKKEIRRVKKTDQFTPIRIHFLPDGKKVLFGLRDGRVRIEDFRTGGLVQEFQGHPWNRSRSGDQAFERSAVSRDGRLLAMASYDGMVSLWELATPQLLARFTNHTSGVCSAAFSPDGRFLATVSKDQTIRLWDVSKLMEKAILRGHAGEVWDVRFTPDGRRLLSGGADGVLRVWDLTPKTKPDEVEVFPAGTQSACLYARDKLFATWTTNNAWTFWDLETRQPIEQFPANTNFWPEVFSPAARTFCGMIPNQSFSLRNIDTGRQFVVSSYAAQASNILVYPGPGTKYSMAERNTSKASWGTFSPDGTLYADYADLGEILRLTVWDVVGGKEKMRIHGSGDTRRTAEFSPSNRYLAIGEVNGNLRVVELASGRESSFAGHTYCTYALAFSPDEQRLATGGFDSTVRLWDLATGRQLASFPAEDGNFYSIAFSADGRRLVGGMGGKSDKPNGIVRVWDLESMREVVTRIAHATAVVGVGFIDENTLVSLSSESLRVWRAPSSAETEAAEKTQ